MSRATNSLVLNPRNQLYRTQNMKEHAPSRAEAMQRMGKQPNLSRRPMTIRDSPMVVGFDQEGYKKLIELSALLAEENTKQWR